MLQQKKPYEDWYVVFCAAKLDMWIHRFTGKEMAHVYCVRREGDYWLKVDPKVYGLDMELIPWARYPHIRSLAGPTDKIIKVKSCYNGVVFGTPGFNTCVEAVKGVLGIRDIFCLTVKQLYNNLKAGKYGQ